MQISTSPEILCRIFTLVESKADLARAGRLNKFVGAIALDTLWNDIEFKRFLSLFPTQTTKRNKRTDTRVVIPLIPLHWQRANIYARRIRILRRGDWTGGGMDQILTSLQLYGCGPETPFIFPRLRCLIWDCDLPCNVRELALIARVVFPPPLQELSIQTNETETSRALLSPSSISLDVASRSTRLTLKTLHLHFPAFSNQSLEAYHPAIIDLLLYLPKDQLEEVSVVITKDIISVLSTFPNLSTLTLHDISTIARSFNSRTSGGSIGTTSFKNLQTLSLHNLASVISLDHLNYFRCAPSRHMKIFFSGDDNLESDIFLDIIHLLNPRKGTLKSLEMWHGAMDLTPFADWLLTLPNLEELVLGSGIALQLQDDILALVNTEWTDLPSLTIYSSRTGYINFLGYVCPRNGVYLLFKLCFLSARDNKKTKEIVDLTSLLKWMFTFPKLEELSSEVPFNVSDEMLRLMGTKWRNLTTLTIYHNKASLVSLDGILALRSCPIEHLALYFTLSKKDIDEFRRRINNSEAVPLYSLKKFEAAISMNGFSDDIAGAAFVLAYLFPNAKFGPLSKSKATTPPDPLVERVLQTRMVVLEMLKTPDMVNLSQIIVQHVET